MTLLFNQAAVLAAVALAGLVSPVPGRPVEGITLEVRLVGLRSDQGSARVALWRTREGFPNDSEKAARRYSLPIVDGVADIVIEGLEPGDWAIAAFHDENDNGRLDTRMFGIPKEGVAVSRDARGRFGPPSFEQAKVQLAGRRPQTITLRVVYP